MDSDIPSVDDVFGTAPPTAPKRLPNSPFLPGAEAFPQGMIRPAKKNPLDMSAYPQGVEGIGGIEISEDGVPFEALTISREHGRDLSRDEMMQKYREGHDFGGFDSPEALTAHARALYGDDEPSAPDVPSVDDVFGGIDDSWVKRFDRNLQQSTFRIFDAFGYSGAKYFGDEPIATANTVLDPEFEGWLRDNHIFNDYAKGQIDVSRGIFEGLFKGVAAGAALTARAASAAAAAPAGALGQFLEEVGLVTRGREQLEGAPADPGLAMVLNPFGEFTALNAIANARRQANLHVDLSTARANGVLAEGEAGFFGAHPVSPENAQTRVEAANQAGIPVPEPLPVAPDVHVLARRIDPAATERFDALEAEKAAHQQTIQAIIAQRESSAEVIAAREEIARIAGEPREVPDLTPPEPSAVPIDDEIGSNIFMRPQPEDVPQPTLPAPPSGPVTSLPIVERAPFDEAALRAEDARLNQELRGLPRGGRQASDRLSRLATVERNLADPNLTRESRLALLRRRDELLTDTTPEKLRAEASPLERRRAIQAEREAIADRLAKIEIERARKRSGAISEPKIPVSPESLEAAPPAAQAGRLAAAEARLEAALNAPSAEIDAARAALNAARTEQMGLLPNVLSAYRQASEMMPPKQKVVDAVVAASEGGATPKGKPSGPSEPKVGDLVQVEIGGAAQLREPAVVREVIDHEGQKWVFVEGSKTGIPIEQVRIETPVAPPAGKPAKPSGGPALRPVEGTGETKTRTLAEGVEASAIERELTEGFGDLPAYQEVSMFEQGVKASTFLTENPEAAMAVAMGEKMPPRGLLPESVFVAVERAAIAAGDVETLRRLATESKLTTAATTMGQRIRTLGERDRLSPGAAIQEVLDARRADLERRNATAVKDTVAEIKAAARGSAPKRADWTSFINSITCAD